MRVSWQCPFHLLSEKPESRKSPCLLIETAFFTFLSVDLGMERELTVTSSIDSQGDGYRMTPMDLVKLTALMERTSGRAEIKIGLIDGPVAINHSDLATENIREIPGKLSGTCAQANSTACLHGTFVAGILCGKRNSTAPAICPQCTLLVRPIFAETIPGNGQMPSATPQELAAAITESIEAGARVINLSAALAQPSSKGERELE